MRSRSDKRKRGPGPGLENDTDVHRVRMCTTWTMHDAQDGPPDVQDGPPDEQLLDIIDDERLEVQIEQRQCSCSNH
eukprot:1181974-Amphidinium_carterae.1